MGSSGFLNVANLNELISFLLVNYIIMTKSEMMKLSIFQLLFVGCLQQPELADYHKCN